MRVVINGFGRIGRTILRQVLARPGHADIEIVALNDIAPTETCAYLFKYDSVFGVYPGTVEAEIGALAIDNKHFPFTQERDLGALDLTGVDVLLDCTGTIRTRAQAARGLAAGAANVLISGPCPEAEATLVIGANEDTLGSARIVSNASCTTNALAPLLRAVDDSLGLVQGHMTTIHCYTGSQPMVDAPREDLARSRAGAVSMVPTTTSASKLIDLVLPKLGGRVTGAAVRVPVISVSAVDAVLTVERDLPADLSAWQSELAAATPVIGITQDATVSTDLRGRPESLILAPREAMAQGPRQVRLFGWYDNEWGFSARMIDMARLMAAR